MVRRELCEGVAGTLARVTSACQLRPHEVRVDHAVDELMIELKNAARCAAVGCSSTRASVSDGAPSTRTTRRRPDRRQRNVSSRCR